MDNAASSLGCNLVEALSVKKLSENFIRDGNVGKEKRTSNVATNVSINRRKTSCFYVLSPRKFSSFVKDGICEWFS